MEINRAEAEASLGEIEQTMAHTRGVISSGIASPLLMIWGIIWALAFGASFVWPDRQGQIWLAADSVGLLGTTAVVWSKRRREAMHSERQRWLAVRLFWFAIFLCAYGVAWGWLMKPQDGRQVAAFIVMLVMFGYVVLGLWLESAFLLMLGLAVTGLTMAGYLLLTDMFNLWMAIAGGGALFVSGLYMRLKWS
jgi:hypothetical protein